MFQKPHINIHLRVNKICGKYEEKKKWVKYKEKICGLNGHQSFERRFIKWQPQGYNWISSHCWKTYGPFLVRFHRVTFFSFSSSFSLSHSYLMMLASTPSEFYNDILFQSHISTSKHLSELKRIAGAKKKSHYL